MMDELRSNTKNSEENFMKRQTRFLVELQGRPPAVDKPAVVAVKSSKSHIRSL